MHSSSQLSLKNRVLHLQQTFGSRSESDRKLKWELLKDLSCNFLNKENTCGGYCMDTSTEYCAILRLLLDSLTPTLFTEKRQQQLFDDFFLQGVHHDSFIVLMQYLSKSSPNYQQTKLLDLLEKFLHNGLVYKMLHDQCFSDSSEKLRLISSLGFWDELITLLVSLPERIANKFNQRVKKIFTISQYIPFLCSNMWKIFCHTHERLQSEQDCNLEFIGRLVARLCLAGHTNIVATRLCSKFVSNCENDFVWRRISQKFISKLSSSSIEHFMAQMLQTIPWYGYMDWLLGDLVVTNQKLQYLFTVKFMVIRLFTNVLVLQNIIGYLASSVTRRHLFDKVLKMLLATWADESALRHQNFQQQYYLASGLLVSASHLKALKMESKDRDLIQKTLEGVQLRIGNPEPAVRSIGAIVGESLTSILDTDVPKLELSEELQHKDTDHLKELLCVPQRPEKMDNQYDDIDMDVITEFNEEKPNSDVQKISEAGTSAGGTLDSDDEEDLKPYDMSDDLPEEATKRPLYIRDCLQGLLEAEKPEWTEQCLKSAEGLIRANPDEVSDVAVELSKVLLHLDNSFGMEDFIPYKHRALIALTTHCPVQVAQYLTAQFYERDYNIRQRIDILEVVAAASQELSQPSCRIVKHQSTSTSTTALRHTEENWRSIVEKRLEAKTRRISLGPRKPIPEPEGNMFGSVAGYFFFPLLEKFDRKNKMLDLFGDDSYVLGRLLHTLGIVMYSATNTIQARKMGSSLLKFIAAVRNNTEKFVRQAAIFATSTVYMSVPAFHLLSDLQEDILDSQSWLNEVVEKDFDAECQIQAARTLRLLLNTVEEELPAISRAMLDS